MEISTKVDQQKEGTVMKPKLMSTQQQVHSNHRSKIKRGFVLSVLTMLVFVTTVSSTASADAVTRWNEIAMTVTTPPWRIWVLPTSRASTR